MSSPPDPGAADVPSLGGRLHPSAIAIWASQQAVGLLVLLIFGGGPFGFGALLAGALLAVTVVASTIRWSRFRWSVSAGNLVIEQGLLQRSRRVIPADRVQSVDLIRPVRHRLLSVVQVRVEAIGGRDSEGQLEALDGATAAAIQHALLGARAPRPTPVQDPRPPAAAAAGSLPPPPRPAPATSTTGPRQLAKVTTGNLVVAGLTGGRVGVVAVILGGLQQVVGDRFEDAARLVPTDLGLLGLVLLGVAAVTVVFLLSILATVVTYYDFTVMRDEHELRISRGLLEQRLETVPLHRIQALRIEQNLLRRALGLASVRADLAGRAGGSDPGVGLLLPIAPVEQARRLVADLLESPRPVEAALRGPPLRSRRRYVVRGVAFGLLAALVATAGVVVVDGPAWLPVLVGAVGLATGVAVALSWWRALGSAEVEGVLVARTGLVVRRRVHVPVGRVQRMSVRASPFQRRLRLADVQIGIARSGGWEGPRMPELDVDAALALTARTVHPGP